MPRPLTVLCTLHIFLPCLAYIAFPAWSLPGFAPRQLIYSNDLFPLLAAPWSAPTTISAFLSRLVQAALLYHLPPTTAFYCYPLWMFIALARTLAAFIFTRSVGWAYPPLFSHNSAYEISAGFGPMLVACFYLTGTSDIVKFLPGQSKNVNVDVVYVLAGFCTLLCWLDNCPWTYAIAMLCVAMAVILRNFFFPKPSLKVMHPMTLNGYPLLSPVAGSSLVAAALLSLLLILAPSRFHALLSFSVHTSMPDSPFSLSPLLNILVLSSPRPNRTAATLILTTTIASYLPHLNPNVTLSVFTHFTDHTAFADVRQNFSNETSITFHTDSDSHPDFHFSQYLHLAEAFRWQSERGAGQAEWVMLVEDDFPICGGIYGWSVVARVMQILESGRGQGSEIPIRRGGFVGTGGSGLIVHKTLLPTLTHLLLTHASIVSHLPAGIDLRPADLVVQDCLLGNDPICPPKRDKGLIITSRLVMDHIGGMASTNTEKPQNSDKWRCGWRHPFHGKPEVDVVVVDAGIWHRKFVL